MPISECLDGDKLCYLMSTEVLGFLNWFVSAVTITGFFFTIWQLFKIKTATQSAQSAINQIKTHVDGVNLAYVNAQINAILLLIKNNDFSVAQILFTPIKRSIRLHANEKKIDIIASEQLNRTFAKIDHHISWGAENSTKFNNNTLHRTIDELLSIVTSWESETLENNRKEVIK